MLCSLQTTALAIWKLRLSKSRNHPLDCSRKGIARQGFSCLLLRLLREQPLSPVVSDGLEPVVADPLAVLPGHRRINMAHQGVSRHLVVRLAGNRLEAVTDGVEVPAAAILD